MDPLIIQVSDGHANHKTQRITRIVDGRKVKADICLACDNAVISYAFDPVEWTQENAEAWAMEQHARQEPEEDKMTSAIIRLEERLTSLFKSLGLSAANGDAVDKPAGDVSLEREDELGDEAAAFSLAIYRLIEAGNQPVFEFALARDEAVQGVVVNEKGWIKKPILRTGEWAEAPPGSSTGDPLKITLAHLQLVKTAYDDGAFERVCVPMGHGAKFDDMEYVTEHNTGYVMELEINERPDGEYSLDAWIKFTDPETEKHIRLGNIWNCSVLLTPTVRPRDGKKYPVALKHVALTNYPWVEGLPGFVAASQQAVHLQPQQTNIRRHTMENELTQEQKEALEAMEKAKITPQDVLAFQANKSELEAQLAQREQALQERESAIVAEQDRLTQEARKARVDSVILALEGKHEMEGVTVVKGYRHYPAVVERVGEALRGIPSGMTVQLSRDGKDEQVDVANVVLGIVNALPQGARLSIANPDIEDHARNIEDEEIKGPEDVTPELVEGLAASLGWTVNKNDK